jgi:hypothetical protein
MTTTSDPTAAKLRLRRRLTAILLVVGFTAAVLVFILAGPPAANPLGYEPLETKSYVHDLEVYGGKWNVLAEEFRDWFVGLWHGRTLAFTLAAITLFLVGAVRIFTTPLPPQSRAELEPHADRRER